MSSGEAFLYLLLRALSLMFSETEKQKDVNSLNVLGLFCFVFFKKSLKCPIHKVLCTFVILDMCFNALGELFIVLKEIGDIL